MSADRRSSGPFRVGDRVQLTGPKGRMNTITLEPGKLFHSHRGVLAHDSIIGLPDGSVVTTVTSVNAKTKTTTSTTTTKPKAKAKPKPSSTKPSTTATTAPR